MKDSFQFGFGSRFEYEADCARSVAILWVARSRKPTRKIASVLSTEKFEWI